MGPDILERLDDLHTQATKERSHYYVAKCAREAMDEITRLRHENEILVRQLARVMLKEADA
jgi:hypothetical protein